MPKLLLAARGAAATAPPSHDGFYSSCVTVIIAVMVVLYFDERVRGHLTARQRGTAIGWLAGILTIGLMTPLLVMAGVISDTVRIREVTAAFTLLVRVAVFGTAISIWGREDGARMRATQTAPALPPPLPPAPAPRAGMTELEHAGEVLGAAMAIIGQALPQAVALRVERSGREAERQRLSAIVARWTEIQPSLLALGAAYPLAAVRTRIGPFIQAAAMIMMHPAALLDDPECQPGSEALAAWLEQGDDLCTDLTQAWEGLASALHSDEPGHGVASASTGRQLPGSRHVGQRPKWARLR